jgi:hypothetical protein
MTLFSLATVRDIRIGLGAKMFDVAETALKIRLSRLEDLQSFFQKMQTSMYSMECLSRLLTPLPGKYIL